jgi:hypothetical protein
MVDCQNTTFNHIVSDYSPYKVMVRTLVYASNNHFGLTCCSINLSRTNVIDVALCGPPRCMRHLFAQSQQKVLIKPLFKGQRHMSVHTCRICPDIRWQLQRVTSARSRKPDWSHMLVYDLEVAFVGKAISTLKRVSSRAAEA